MLFNRRSINDFLPFIQMISDRMFGYAISKAAQNIASKNTAPVYFHEFGYSGEYSIVADIDQKSFSRGSGG